MLANHSLHSKNFVITGGSSGIGFALALSLAHAGGRVILAEHNQTRGVEAAHKISQMAHNLLVHSVAIDLANFSSVIWASGEIRSIMPHIHGIFCNAAMTPASFRLEPITVDGFNRMFQINFLGHAILIQKLIAALRPVQGKCIFMLSGVAYGGCWDEGCLKLHDISRAAKSPRYTMSSYMISKYAMGFYLAELGRREPFVKVFSVDPGLVNTKAEVSAWSWQKTCNSLSLPQPCPLTPDQGAQTPAWLVVSEHATTGNFFYLCTQVLSPWHIYAQKYGDEEELKLQQEVFALALGTSVGDASDQHAFIAKHVHQLSWFDMLSCTVLLKYIFSWQKSNALHKTLW